MSKLINGIIKSMFSLVFLLLFFYDLLPYVHSYLVLYGLNLMDFVNSIYYIPVTVILIITVMLREMLYYKWYRYFFTAFYIAIEVLLLYILLNSGILLINRGSFGLPASLIINFRYLLYLIIFSEILIIISKILRSFYIKNKIKNETDISQN